MRRGLDSARLSAAASLVGDATQAVVEHQLLLCAFPRRQRTRRTPTPPSPFAVEKH